MARGAQSGRFPTSSPSDDSHHHHHKSLPTIDFPRFDGSCPKLWQQRCEDYFRLYGTHKSLWIPVATMQFEGTAARWLQSVQRKVSEATWEDFCSWLLVRFGRNQNQALLRQLYHIHQTTSVGDYVDRFSELIDHLAAYEPNLDTVHYTTRFLDGSKPAIRSIISIQCPVDLDTAYSLALLQEEVVEVPTMFHSRHPPLLTLPAPPRRPLPLPAPPAAKPPLLIENKNSNESSRSNSADDK